MDHSGFDQIFHTLSPIYGSVIHPGRGTMFASIDEDIEKTVFNT
jgi:hypothetical protein